MAEATKYCAKCEQVKATHEFSPARNKKDGLQHWCKRCLSDYSTRKAALEVRHRRGLPDDTPSLRGASWRAKPDGHTIIEKAGYILEKRTGHHRGDKYGWVFQHILVAEEKYGFPITRAFTVHHRNAKRADNRPENLELRLGNHGKGGDALAVLLCSAEGRAEAVEILRCYGYDVRLPLTEAS